MKGHWEHEELKKYPEVKGVFVGGCIAGDWRKSSIARAHAHNYHEGPYFGFICVRSAENLLTPDGKLSNLMLHEIAHILVPNRQHSAGWRRKLWEIGGELEFKEPGPRRKMKSKNICHRKESWYQSLCSDNQADVDYILEYIGGVPDPIFKRILLQWVGERMAGAHEDLFGS